MADQTFYLAFEQDSESGEWLRLFVSEEMQKAQKWIDDRQSEGVDEAVVLQSSTPEVGGSTETPSTATFGGITKEFLLSINKMHRLIPITMTLLPNVERYEFDRRIYQPVSKTAKKIGQADQFQLYECKVDALPKIRRALREIEHLREGTSSLPGMFLMGLVSTYDAFLADLLRLVFLSKPEMLAASERILSFKELTELGSVEAAREYILAKEVEAFLRKSHHEQIASLEAKLGMPLRIDLPVWPRFIEVCERRNLIAHTNGAVSQQYIQVCKDHNVDVGDLKVGDQLVISAKYLNASVDVVLEFGWKLIQTCWRKLRPEELKEAAESLVIESYELLRIRRFKMVQAMLEFGLGQKRHDSDLYRKMMVVNLAIALKCIGDERRAVDLLAKEDWTAAADKFRICVAAVLEDVDQVVGLMSKISDDQVNRLAFREWPAFQWVVSNTAFIAAFEARYGEPFVTDWETSVEKRSTEEGRGDQEGQETSAHLNRQK
ncbi:hypothetical protein FLL57_04005 [Rhodopseudomonas palustris]|uniref:hypothetical protein n=1 Tax=Rhodopseudomonas palustris TaxID=1076 RepID=UPI00115DEAEF|nr:hypothetical protein [Rhodopseudomonas palustris]QDL96521.1 hypothetical protein FLL57_04005 [Rhodopseudomonas palustris]